LLLLPGPGLHQARGLGEDPRRDHRALPAEIRRGHRRQEERRGAGRLPVARSLKDQPRALDWFRATAARMSSFNAFSSILSPSRKSIARLVFPSRLELKRREGSFSDAPWAKVISTTLL